MESILREGHLRTGLFTSPHLVDVRERIRVNGGLLPMAKFEEHVMDTYHLLGEERMETIGFFQFLTLTTLRLFSKTTTNGVQVDVLILETGIGGKLDFTNAVDQPLCCAITRLDFDHTELLGKTIQLIAAQKAGICKKGVPLFTPATQEADGLPVIQEVAKEQNAPLILVDELKDVVGIGIHGGPPQIENASLASEMAKFVFKKLKNNDDSLVRGYISSGLKNCKFPGRAQVEKNEDGTTFFLDGAHTPKSVEFASIWFASSSSSDSERVLVFHCSPDRDYELLLKKIYENVPNLRKAFFVKPTGGVNPGTKEFHDQLANEWGRLDKKNEARSLDHAKDLRKEIDNWKAKGEIKDVFVIGSFYTIGDALTLWIDNWDVEKAFPPYSKE